MGFLKAMKKRARFLGACLALALWAGQPASALPEGYTVQNGQVTITGSGQTMTISQVGQKAIINWNGFSISAGEMVKFLQPNQMAAILNRVTGVEPSVINGVMQANGNIFLINPNGVLIGPGGMVNAGSFLASTLDVSNADFLKGTPEALAGSMKFRQVAGKDQSAVVNQGQIKVNDGGFVVLMAPSVATEGVILAKGGEVKLGAGTEATVNFDGGELINFAFKAPTPGTGTLVMSQADANNVLAQAVNSLDIEEAGSLSVGGTIDADSLQAVAQQADIEVDQTTRSIDLILETSGNVTIGEWFALDGHSIEIDISNGNLTFDTLVAEQLNGQGGVVDISVTGSSSNTSGNGNITGTTSGQGIAADLVLLSADGNISTAVAANSVRANAGGNVNLSLRPGIIDGSNPTTSGDGSGSGTSGTNSTGTSSSTTSTGGQSSSSSTGVLNPGSSQSGQVFGVSPGGSGSSGSDGGQSGSSHSGGTSEQVFGTATYRSSDSTSTGSGGSTTSNGTGGTSTNTGVSPGIDPQIVLQQQTTTGTVGTPVGQNGTLVYVQAGGDVNVDSVNTVIVDQISGRNVTVRSQTGSVVDDGDAAGRDNRDIIASQNANLSARDFLGTIDDPLEVQIGGDLEVFAANEVDGISGVLVGDVFGQYIQNSETAGIVLLNPGTSQSDGIPQAIHGIMDNNGLPGDDTVGGASLTNLFFLRLINSIDEDEWLEILRGTVIWEDSGDEAQGL